MNDEANPTAATPPKLAGLPWRVFRMNDFDWWMARTEDEARQFFSEAQHCSCSDCVEYGLLDGVREVTDEELDRLVYIDDECSLEDPSRKRSFRAELARRVRVDRVEFPQLFATTEL